ncbi:MAG: hypothetical protein P4L98_06155 [Ancalomicrobiaceae bacterium]|nr:hypothetical protein [Ancalomicrobiaceae bacterium]
MIKIFVWDCPISRWLKDMPNPMRGGSITSMPLGHTAMQVGPVGRAGKTTYISWNPKSSSSGLWNPSSGRKTDFVAPSWGFQLADDVKQAGPPSYLSGSIYLLDELKISTWWDSLRWPCNADSKIYSCTENTYYDLLNFNCANVVYGALQVGGADKLIGPIFPYLSTQITTDADNAAKLAGKVAGGLTKAGQVAEKVGKTVMSIGNVTLNVADIAVGAVVDEAGKGLSELGNEVSATGKGLDALVGNLLSHVLAPSDIKAYAEKLLAYQSRHAHQAAATRSLLQSSGNLSHPSAGRR